MNIRTLILTIMACVSSVTAKSKPHPVNPELELIISSTQVTNSSAAAYPGMLSFGRLIETNYGEKAAASIVRSWILSYAMPTKVAGQVIPPREKAFGKVIESWVKKDGFTGESLLDWTPNLANAPLKLLSIVNRQDIAIASNVAPTSELHISRAKSPLLDASLSEQEIERIKVLSRSVRNSSSSGGSSSGYYRASSGAGEVRFIYCLTDQSGTPLKGGMTVILEFDQLNLFSRNNLNVISVEKSAHYTAKRWHALGRHKVINSAYLSELCALVFEAITPIETPNLRPTVNELIAASPMLRLRTNDSALGEGREFRQFDSSGKSLIPSLLSSSLPDAFNDPKTPEAQALAKWLTASNVLSQELTVNGKRVKLATASSRVLPGRENDTAWKSATPTHGGQVSREIRRHISMNSCIGCHGQETGSDGFHIAPPSNDYLPSLLSEFLTDTSKIAITKDPYADYEYKQAGELARRIKIFEHLVDPKILNLNRFQKLTADAKHTSH